MIVMRSSLPKSCALLHLYDLEVLAIGVVLPPSQTIPPLLKLELLKSIMELSKTSPLSKQMDRFGMELVLLHRLIMLRFCRRRKGKSHLPMRLEYEHQGRFFPLGQLLRVLLIQKITTGGDRFPQGSLQIEKPFLQCGPVLNRPSRSLRVIQFPLGLEGVSQFDWPLDVIM